jgi:hypothetical protein
VRLRSTANHRSVQQFISMVESYYYLLCVCVHACFLSFA